MMLYVISIELEMQFMNGAKGLGIMVTCRCTN